MSDGADHITLREVTAETVRAICNLSVHEDQKQFVAPNAVSIAQAYFSKEAWFRAVYADDTPVGFVMLADDPAKPEYYLWRFMIDARYQRQRYGRRAMELVIEHVRRRPGAVELLTSVVQADGGPQGFYESLGFQLTGEYEDGEAVMRLPLQTEPGKVRVRLFAHDPNWPSQFAALADRIRSALGDRVLVLEHVGSTAVPGLSAKPIIDIVLAVADSTDEASYVPALEAQGFAFRLREPHWYEHRLLRAPGPEGNLHVFSAGCEEIDRMLAFRDWLRQDERDRRHYEEAKRELAAREWVRGQDYADAKTDVIREILSRAGA